MMQHARLKMPGQRFAQRGMNLAAGGQVFDPGLCFNDGVKNSIAHIIDKTTDL